MNQTLNNENYLKALKCVHNPIVDENGNKFTFDYINYEELEEVTEIAFEAWDLDKIGDPKAIKKWRADYFKKLYGINNKLFTLIKKNDDSIGYLSVIPMKKDRHFIGAKNQYDFNKEDICSSMKSNLIYIQGIYLKFDFRNKKCAYQIVVKAMLSQIADHLDNIEEGVLYAEIFSNQGRKFLSNIGLMDTSRIAYEGESIYSLPLATKEEEDQVIQEYRDSIIGTRNALFNLKNSSL